MGFFQKLFKKKTPKTTPYHSIPSSAAESQAYINIADTMEYIHKRIEMGEYNGEFDLINRPDKDINKRYEHALKTHDMYEIHEIALMYDEGNGVPKDQTRAFELFLYAAQEGYARSQNAVAICYECGDGVEIDIEQAVYWYQKAAEGGNLNALRQLGAFYATGDAGFPTNRAKGLNLIAEAGLKGDDEAIKYHEKVFAGCKANRYHYKHLDFSIENPCDAFFALSTDALNGNPDAINDINYMFDVQRF